MHRHHDAGDTVARDRVFAEYRKLETLLAKPHKIDYAKACAQSLDRSIGKKVSL